MNDELPDETAHAPDSTDADPLAAEPPADTDPIAAEPPADADDADADRADADAGAESPEGIAARDAPGEASPPQPPPSAQDAVAPPPGFRGPPPGAGPASPPGPRRLTRSRDRKLGGVAGGIAEYVGIDPTLVRLGFLLAIFIGGAGAIAYVVAWIVLPESDGSSPGGAGQAPMRIRRDGSGIDTTTALAVGLLVFAVLFGLASPDGGQVLVPIAMIAGGIWLLSQRAPSHPDGDGPATFSPAASAAGSMTGTTAFRADETGRFTQQWEHPVTDPLGTDVFPHPDPPSSRTPTPDPRRPAVVTRVTLSLVALLAAGAIAANELDLFDVTVPGVLAVALVVVGVGAITAAFVGRGRGLVPVGLLLALLFAGAATVQPLVDDGTGRRSYAPATAADVRDRYDLGIGELDVDLSGLAIAAGTTVETTVDLGIGSAQVLVPDDVEVIVDGEVGIGDLRVFEFEENGFGNDLRRTRSVEVVDGATPTIDDNDAAEPGRLVVRLDVGIGEGVVRNG